VVSERYGVAEGNPAGVVRLVIPMRAGLRSLNAAMAAAMAAGEAPRQIGSLGDQARS
jgi:tRNA(Leu) C34 or U34 (ribose-2'-O)-methylase TrmL